MAITQQNAFPRQPTSGLPPGKMPDWLANYNPVPAFALVFGSGYLPFGMPSMTTEELLQ